GNGIDAFWLGLEALTGAFAGSEIDSCYGNLPLIHLDFEEIEVDRREVEQPEVDRLDPDEPGVGKLELD
ncbi:hypothetical protein Tco_1072618, partial [Tanacetum coccineum]